MSTPEDNARQGRFQLAAVPDLAPLEAEEAWPRPDPGRSSEPRDLPASDRARVVVERERAAGVRDLLADARDRSAEARDRAAVRELAARTSDDPGARCLRRALAGARADRAAAAADRAAAAADRWVASDERRQARLELQRAAVDELTGVQSRGPGWEALQSEIDRARRAGVPFVLAFIDVDGLKRTNDSYGHAAGDALLRATAAAIKSCVRSYDLIARIGGAEFVCGFTDTNLESGRRRVQEIQAALRRSHPGASISVGLAPLDPHDSLQQLVARSDADLYSVKHGG